MFWIYVVEEYGTGYFGKSITIRFGFRAFNNTMGRIHWVRLVVYRKP